MAKSNSKPANHNWPDVAYRLVDALSGLAKARNYIGLGMLGIICCTIMFIQKYPADRLPDIIDSSLVYVFERNIWMIPCIITIVACLIALIFQRYAHKKEMARICKLRFEAIHGVCDKRLVQLPEHNTSNIGNNVTIGAQLVSEGE
jgi:hypothetical protein